MKRWPGGGDSNKPSELFVTGGADVGGAGEAEFVTHPLAALMAKVVRKAAT